MKLTCTLFVLLTVAVPMCAEGPGAGACPKNVSFAVIAGGQPVAGIPNFVVHSIGSEKHLQRYPGLCFSQSPDARSKNYVVIFSTDKQPFHGVVPSVLKYVNAAPVSQDNTISEIYGEMWHYTTSQPAAPNTTTLNLVRIETSGNLYAKAYNEQGSVVSEVGLDEISGWFHTREKMLDRVLEEIRSDQRPLTAPPGALKTSLPVYYINCDVPVKSLDNQIMAATQSSQAAAPPPPPPVPTVEFSSNPIGADVYIDTRLVGKTPLSLSVQPGEHVFAMRKQNFGMWQQVMDITQNRKITGYLEQKIVTFGSALP